MSFSATTLDSIRDRLDLAELVREYVPGLKKTGRNYKACCPFHQEKTPSFMVSPDKQIFHCFGCSAGGDVFKFLMQMESLSFPEAVEKLAQRAGVEVKASSSLGPQDKERLSLKSALNWAKDYYRGQLLKSGEAEAARAHIKERQVSLESASRFELGYAPSGGTAFLEAALRQGLSPQVLSRAGLLSLRESTGKYRDTFCGRLLFPILNAKGETAGFGGRALRKDQEPKYLNSPETPLFSKGRLLYGLYQGSQAVRQARKVLILEGYMDVIAAHQHGFAWAVAPLGTALTPDHVQTIRRYGEEVVLLFDPDAAGDQAALRSAQLLLEHGLEAKIVCLPESLDPDEYLNKHGAEAFQKAVEGAVDLMEFQLSLALGSGRALDAYQKSRVASSLLATVSRQPNFVVRQEWLRRLSQRLDVSEESLIQEMKRVPGPAASRRPGFSAGRPPSSRPSSAPGPEEHILELYLNVPSLLAQEAGLGEEDFKDERCLRLWKALHDLPAEALWGKNFLAHLLDRLPGEDSAWVSSLVLQSKEFADAAGELKRMVFLLKKRRRLVELEPEIRAMLEGKIEVDAGKKREYHELLKELKGTA